MATVDGRSALIGSITPILDKEVEAGLQSSANRVITMPSAMADAREAGEKDDTRTLGIMEKIRRVMNKEIIPRVLGEGSGIEFVWGTQDDFEIEMPPGVIDAVKLGLIAKDSTTFWTMPIVLYRSYEYAKSTSGLMIWS